MGNCEWARCARPARSASDRPDLVEMFRRGLGEAGYVEGRNIAIGYRYADNQPNRLRALATDLIARQAGPLGVRAQQPAMPVIGFLDPRSPHTVADQLGAFRQGLKDTGYVEGDHAMRQDLQKKRPTFIKRAPACSLSTKLQSSQTNSGCMRPELGRLLQ
jgi:hypothetical protein